MSNILISKENGWNVGFLNMLKKENAVWWKTRKWIVHGITWTIIITGGVSFILYFFTRQAGVVIPDPLTGYKMGSAALETFFNVVGFSSVIGVIILTHDLIIGERETGTMEWVLSKPLSRSAFVLSKIMASIIWITLVMILLQGALFLLVVHLFKGEVELLYFFKGLAVVWLICIFYISMLIFLGTQTTSRGVVLGLSFLFFLIGGAAPIYFRESIYLMPWELPKVAFAVSMRAPWSGMLISPIVMTIFWSILFTVGALWRIERLDI